VWVKQTCFTIFAALLDRRPRAMIWTWGAALAMSLAWLAALYAGAGDGLWLMPPFGEREAALPYVVWSWSQDKVLLLVHVIGIVILLLAAHRGMSDVLTRRLALAALAMALPALLRVGTHRAWPSAVLAIAAAARLVAGMPMPIRSWAMAAGAASVLVLGGVRWWINDWSFDGFRLVAARVAQETPAGETNIVGPHEPLIYCMAERLSPTRYDFALPWAPSPAARRELLADLTAAPPRVIVDVSDVFESVQGRLSDSLPGIEALLAQRYLPPEQVAGFEVYLRADEAPGVNPMQRP
jgi:hypothetical protein